MKKYVPVEVMRGVKSASLGAYHTCAIKQDSSLWCWGSNYSGQVGTWAWNTKVTMPVQIMSSGVSSVAAGGLSYLCNKDGWFIMVLGE
jgi:alpha-tubulin suppressor-like RCC1 family protein